MESRSKNIPGLALDLFQKFSTANSFQSILAYFRELCTVIEVSPSRFTDFFPVIKANLTSNEIRELLSKYEKRVSNKCYNNGKACRGTNVLIVGAGPCGLRTAIEAQLLGARVVVLEKRTEFSRKNVLHIWPFVISELRGLGAKKFCPKFCAGSIDHVSICQLQCILLKIGLLLGVQVVEGREFQGLSTPQENSDLSWRAVISPPETSLGNFPLDVLIGADGRQNILPGFKRKELRAKLAIAITANFVNRHSAAEARVQEISGVSFIFKQAFFQDLCQSSGIDLENIVYYKDETHYFVMTAKKHSLLWKGVLKENYSETADLLSTENIDLEALCDYTTEAVNFATENQIPNLEFAVNARGQPDVAIFDFTTMYAAENACRVMERNGRKLLLGLVGDSLLEPFWPTGSGCARGFLSAMDAAWMIRSWGMGEDALEVLAERETIYRLLAQTTHENLSKDHANYTADPQSRYPNLVLGTVKPCQVKGLYDTDGEVEDCCQEQLVDSDRLRPQVEIETKNKNAAQYLKRNMSLRDPVSDRRKEAFDSSSHPLSLNVDDLMFWLESTVRDCGISVDGIHDLFVGGDALCAILHAYRPDLIPEYPFPPEIEEGIEEMDRAAFRNQIAFDFLHQEYQLPYIVTGYDSVEYTANHLEELVKYLNQVRRIFTCGITHDEPPGTDQEHLYQDIRTTSKAPSKSERKMDSSRKKINRSATMPTFDSNRNLTKPVRKPGAFGTSILKLQTRFDGSGSFQRGHDACNTRLEDNNSADRPDFRLLNEKRENRLKEAEKCKMKAMQFIALVQARRSEEQEEAIVSRRERAIKSIKAIHVTESEPTQPTEFSTVEKDDFFNEYNMRLWRKSVPTIGERRDKLENVFATLPSKKSKPKVEPMKKPSTQPVGKINKEDWVMKLLAEKFAEGQGHSSIRTDISQDSATEGAQDYSEPLITTVNKSSEIKPKTCERKPPTQIESVPFKGITPYRKAARVVSHTQADTANAANMGKCYYAATTVSTSSTSFIPNKDPFDNVESVLYGYANLDESQIQEPSSDLDDIDEESLAQLDPEELEQLEAWSGKYL